MWVNMFSIIHGLHTYILSAFVSDDKKNVKTQTKWQESEFQIYKQCPLLLEKSM
jgi:hypothetical protein